MSVSLSPFPHYVDSMVRAAAAAEAYNTRHMQMVVRITQHGFLVAARANMKTGQIASMQHVVTYNSFHQSGGVALMIAIRTVGATVKAKAAEDGPAPEAPTLSVVKQ